MADDTITNEPQPEVKEPSRAEERISQLSEKTKQAEEARAAAEAKAKEAERKAQFAEGYAEFLSSNPAAKEFKQQIQEKFNAGIPVEDAGFAVLGKAGKLGASAPVEPANPAGGSAVTNLPEGGAKPMMEMSQAEKREQLAKELIWS